MRKVGHIDQMKATEANSGQGAWSPAHGAEMGHRRWLKYKWKSPLAYFPVPEVIMMIYRYNWQSYLTVWCIKGTLVFPDPSVKNPFSTKANLSMVSFPLNKKQNEGIGPSLRAADFSSKSTDIESVIAKIDGTPYFSMDVADLDVNEKEMNNSFKETEAKY
ncbi:hypothetical protein K435DRAFT_797891 [Dendrothele bispora CBS 962.96]|uniref:Uncharacterized protein n=1 Tax=Dendrothele bispora (strain CBS 962.96) TaxID=1314807 RepID=A0A4S8M102_DENBC|nr:hypothetical protein K435DRAFT_797891 [Dendrothele bispora CBS 962.96]